MATRNQKTQTVSTTVDVPNDLRDWCVKFAEANGQMRTHPQTGERGGNLSWTINEAIRFLNSHVSLFLQERGERLASELEEV